MTHFQAARKNMVDCQIHTNGVIEESILSAFANTPREIFIAEKKQHIAYTDTVITADKDRFLLDPMTHAKLLQAVLPQKHEVVLDIGSGTGYSAAILSPLVSTVIALESRQNIIDKATKTLNEIGACNIAFEKGKLNAGFKEHAPYDLIIINGAIAQIPENIVNQLTVGGRLVTIIKASELSVGQATLIKKGADKQYSSRPLFEASAPYLPGFEPKETFSF